MEISTYWKDPDLKEKAVVKLDKTEELYYVDYYDTMGNIYYTESFQGKSIHYVEDAAENWALGHKILPVDNTQGSLI